MLPNIERILDAARLAPSRDNAQPWRFVVEARTISFTVDAERDRSPMNTGQRMACIALGAALESALVRIARMGGTVRFETPRPNALVTISVSEPKRWPEPDKAIRRRTTNRRLYDARPLDDATLTTLRNATPALEEVRTHWFGRERVRLLGPIVEEAETLVYANARLRDAALAGMRFDARDREEVTYGLSVGSLELSAADRVALDSLRRAPNDLLASQVSKRMGARARKLIESASGVCIVSVRGSDPLSDVVVGRCVQRAWRALSQLEMAAHPMTAIMGMEAMLGIDETTTMVGDPASEPSAAVITNFRSAFPSVEKGSRIAFMMRFGWAPPPTVRVGRRALTESVDELDASLAIAPDASNPDIETTTALNRFGSESRTHAV